MRGGLMNQEYEKIAMLFKAFCDENRLRILELLKEGEKCSCTLLESLEIVQSTLSHHMKILTDSGVVHGRKEGKWVYYSLCTDGTKIAKESVDYFTNRNDNYVAHCHCDF
jgi:ArsR family transcriptional regulator